jgi:hypothetical protein
MFDRHHLRHQIGATQNLRVGITSGEDDLQVRWPLIKEIKEFGKG